MQVVIAKLSLFQQMLQHDLTDVNLCKLSQPSYHSQVIVADDRD